MSKVRWSCPIPGTVCPSSDILTTTPKDGATFSTATGGWSSTTTLSLRDWRDIFNKTQPGKIYVLSQPQRILLQWTNLGKYSHCIEPTWLQETGSSFSIESKSDQSFLRPFHYSVKSVDIEYEYLTTVYFVTDYWLLFVTTYPPISPVQYNSSWLLVWEQMDEPQSIGVNCKYNKA